MEVLEKYSTAIIIVMLSIEAFIMIFSLKRYADLQKKTLYSYKNASFLGGGIFMVIMFAYSLFVFFRESININPVLAFVNDISKISAAFPFITLPFLLVFLLFMSFSNISLIRHEGRTVKNTVGSILGFVLFAATIMGVFGWDIVYENIIMNLYYKGYRWIIVCDVAIPQFLTSLLCYVECLLLGTIISSLKAAKHQPAFDKDYVIILGCAIAKDGKPLPLLQGRIDRAIRFSKEQMKATGRKIKFVPSGGQGSDECISEAESMKGYLLSQGIDENDILLENKSVNTLENMKFSKAVIDADGDGGNIIFSTTNYHVFRSGIYANKADIKAEGISAETKWYFWPNAFVREFVALFVNGKKAHIFNVFIFLIISLISGYVYYKMTI